MASPLEKLIDSKYGPMLALVLRVMLGSLFIYASLDKIWDPGLFAKTISNYRILPLPLLHISAIILPWLEFICGLALIFNRYARAANILIMILLAVFIMAILASMYRGLDFNCGCYNLDAEEANMGVPKVFENIGMLFLSGYLVQYFKRKES